MIFAQGNNKILKKILSSLLTVSLLLSATCAVSADDYDYSDDGTDGYDYTGDGTDDYTYDYSESTNDYSYDTYTADDYSYDDSYTYDSGYTDYSDTTGDTASSETEESSNGTETTEETGEAVSVVYAILSEDCSMKAAENEASLTLGYLNSGSIVECLSEGDNYYLVTADGVEGYIPKQSATVGNAYINDDANLRMGMDKTSKTIKVLGYNTCITVTSQYYEWCSVKAAGKDGYVYSDLITMISAPSYGFSETDKVCTVNRKAIVYSVAKETYYSVKELNIGESFTYESADKDWVKMSDGYVKSSCLVDGNAYVAEDVYLTADGTNNNVIVTIPAFSNITVVEDGDENCYVSYNGSRGFLDSSSVVYYETEKQGELKDDNATVEVDGLSLLNDKGRVQTKLFSGDRIYVGSVKDGKAEVVFEGISGYVEENSYLIDDKYNLSYIHTIGTATVYTTSLADDKLKDLSKGTVAYYMGKDSSGKYVKVIVDAQIGYISADAVADGNGIINSDEACYFSETDGETVSESIALDEPVSIVDYPEEGDFCSIYVDGKVEKICKGYVFLITEDYVYQANLAKKLKKKASLTDESGETLESLKKGTKVTVLEDGEDSIKVVYENTVGYIDSDKVKLYCDGKTTQEVNLMSDVKDGSTVLAVIPIDTDVSIECEYNDLYSKVHYNKQVGYVMSCFLQRTNKDDYTWRSDGSYTYAYDLNGNKLRNCSDLVSGPYKIVAYIGNSENTVVVWCADEKGDFNIPVRTMTCSPGETTPRGTFYVPVTYRWLKMEGDTYAQWCTDIAGNYLFHTVPDYTQNAFDLEVDEYNQLGTTRSLGCIRLLCSDAKYLYDTMELGQEIVITNDPCPFEQPESFNITLEHRWDPTDYDAHYACVENGCH